MAAQPRKELKAWNGTGFRNELEAVRSLCHRPYWDRLWIIQEVLRAKEARIQCGSTYTTWEEFNQFALNIETPPGEDFRVIERSSAFVLNRYQTNFQNGNASIKSLLEAFASSQCLDVRDMVYGLAGHANDKTNLKIDYNKSPSEVFKEVMMLQNEVEAKTLVVAFGQFLQRLLRRTVLQTVPNDAYLSTTYIGTIGYATGKIIHLGPMNDRVVKQDDLDGDVSDDELEHEVRLRFLGQAEIGEAVRALARANGNGRYHMEQLVMPQTKLLVREKVIAIHNAVSYGCKGLNVGEKRR